MTQPLIAILLATYNGAPYLDQQLASFKVQSYPHWRLYVSDDGSTDATLNILQNFQASCADGQVEILSGPCSGFAANFQSLLINKTIQADYFFMADQDDIWLADKTATALEWLAQQSPARPALYCSTSDLINTRNQRLPQPPHTPRQPAICNALVENIAGGNTMGFNNAARTLLLDSEQAILPWHDWWIYLAVMACGGVVFYDIVPHLLYRQHHTNAHGANSLIHGTLRRLRAIWQGVYRDWNTANLAMLNHLVMRWTPEARQAIASFQAIRRSQHVMPRLFKLLNSGLYRQAKIDQLGLLFAALCNKI